MACCVSTVPVTPEPGCSASDIRIITPVAVQIRMVSMNTPSACTKPCDDGWCGLGMATAAMLGAEPMPASLENRPRLTPLSMAAAMLPITPPAACSKPKALLMIRPITAGTLSMLATITHSATPR